MRKKVTIADIAEMTGVSKTTVSRYLNGKYDFMSDETRASIAEAINKTGYRQNRMANSLRTNKSGLIGLVMSNVMSGQTPQLLSSICSTCAEHGLKVIIVNSERDPEREKTLVYELLEQRVDGLLVLSGYNIDFYNDIARDEVPVVLADRIPPDCRLDNVAINHAESVRLLVSHLLAQGFKHLVVLSRPHSNPNNTPQIRVNAAVKTCRDYFGEDGHCDVVSMDLNPLSDADSGTYDRLTALLQESHAKSAERPTAIFVSEAAIMNIVACCYYRASIGITRDFTISGYSDWGFGSLIVPPISTIEQPIMQMGRRAIEMLIRRIDEEGSVEQRSAESSLLTCRLTLEPG